MNKFLVVCLILSTSMIIKGDCRLPDKIVSHSEHEVIYRVLRNIHNEGTECSYKRSSRSECDTATNKETRTLSLRKGGPSCEQTKIITRKCKKACKYEKGEWSECDMSTNTRTRTDNLKMNSDSSCQPTRTIPKKCKKVPKDCQYSKQSPWSACDMATRKRTRMLVLEKGNPLECEPKKMMVKPCRNGGRPKMRFSGMAKEGSSNKDKDEEKFHVDDE